MIAYNRTGLDNLFIRKQAKESFASGCISGEENEKISTAHPVDFYTPNIFICIGLFLLTVLIIACTLGFFGLISAESSQSFTVLLVLFGLICYGALEFTVLKRRHYKSGVDYALLWMSAILLYSGIFLAFENMSITFQCILAIAISLLFAIRFGNYLMAMITYAALLTLIIHIIVLLNGPVQLILPFNLMAVSVGAWFLSDSLYHRNQFRHYRQCFTMMKVASLTSFYLAGNYFVVREMSDYIFGASRNPGGLSAGWLFWILTVTTPLFYIFRGIRRKNSIFLWTGLALIAATIFTIRYYYHVLPAEWACTPGGVMMIVIAYTLIRYLKIPRNGFTSQESSTRHIMENLHLESLVIAETFGGPETVKVPSNDFQFGGGSGGGGGAGGQY
jgi:hypothetical protein